MNWSSELSKKAEQDLRFFFAQWIQIIFYFSLSLINKVYRISINK